MTTVGDEKFGLAGSYVLRSGRRAPLSTYLLELNNQAMFMRIAVKDFMTALESRTGNAPRIFAASQAVLAAAAAASKLLWPPDEEPTKKKSANPRGPALRAAVGDCEHVAMLHSKNRVVRNSYEHFDQRLDEYFETGRQVILDQNVAPSKDMLYIIDSEGVRAPHLRFVNNQDLTISMLDDEADARALLAAVAAVAEHARAALAGQPIDCPTAVVRTNISAG